MKVLVAIDDRPSSQAILDALVKMHWYEGTEIHLITVVPPDSQSAIETEGLAVELHSALRHCEVTFLARPGDPKEVILEFSDQIESDLIVLGSNCKNTLERLFIGSVCQAVLNNANCPVIVAKTPCGLAREASPAFKNVLLPIDSSKFSDAAVHWLANFSWSPETRFTVAAVVEPDTNLEEVRLSLQARASDLSKLLMTDNVVIEVGQGEPRQAIMELAKSHYSDLIVMGSHGRTGLQKLILGSVSQSVSHEAPCAVAIVRGLVGEDSSWKRTGAFSKIKYEHPEPGVAYERPEGRNDFPVQIMPSGM